MFFKRRITFLDGLNIYDTLNLQKNETPIYFVAFTEPNLLEQLKEALLVYGDVNLWDETIFNGPPVIVLTDEDYFSYTINIRKNQSYVTEQHDSLYSASFAQKIEKLWSISQQNSEKFARYRLIDLSVMYGLVNDPKVHLSSEFLKACFRFRNRKFYFAKIIGNQTFIELLAQQGLFPREDQDFASYLDKLFAEYQKTVVVQSNKVSLFKSIMYQHLTNKMCRQYNYYLYSAQDVILNLQNESLLQKKIQQLSGISNLEEASIKQHNKYLENLVQAKKIMKELVSNQQEDKALFYGKYLEKLWSRLYNKIFINNHNEIAKLENKVEPNSLILLCSHRSHIDYLLVSFIFGRYLGYKIPLIAAGINLNFFPVGGIFRNTGAFFIRRKFNNALYINVVKSYLSFIIKKNYSLEFFIEGGRSRTGNLLNAKSGLVNIVVDNYVENPQLDNYFIPTFISYDNVIEIETYLNEMQNISKKKENIFLVLANLRKLKKMGNSYINFAPSIRLRELFEQYYPEFNYDFVKQQIKQDKVEIIKNNLLEQATILINTAVTLSNQSVLACFLHQIKLRQLREVKSSNNDKNLHFSAQQFNQFKDYIGQLFERFVYSSSTVLAFTQSKDLLAQLLIDNKKYLRQQEQQIFIDPQLLQIIRYSRNNIAHVYLAPALAMLCHLSQVDSQQLSPVILSALISYYKIYYSVEQYQQLITELQRYYSQDPQLTEEISQIIALQGLDAILHLVSMNQVFINSLIQGERVLRSKAFTSYRDKLKIYAQQFAIDAAEFFYKTHFDAIYIGVDCSLSRIEPAEQLLILQQQNQLLINLLKILLPNNNKLS